jgi:hypothetical protein
MAELLDVMHGALKSLEQADAVLIKMFEFVKLRAAYFDKLIILNGGTLALSFSAVATFHAHPLATTQQFPIPYLLLAWKLLMSSIVLGRVHTTA